MIHTTLNKKEFSDVQDVSSTICCFAMAFPQQVLLMQQKIFPSFVTSFQLNDWKLDMDSKMEKIYSLQQGIDKLNT